MPWSAGGTQFSAVPFTFFNWSSSFSVFSQRFFSFGGIEALVAEA